MFHKPLILECVFLNKGYIFLYNQQFNNQLSKLASIHCYSNSMLVQVVAHFVLHIVVMFLQSFAKFATVLHCFLDFHDLDIIGDLQTRYFVECSYICICMVFPHYQIQTKDLLIASHCRHYSISVCSIIGVHFDHLIKVGSLRLLCFKVTFYPL